MNDSGTSMEKGETFNNLSYFFLQKMKQLVFDNFGVKLKTSMIGHTVVNFLYYNLSATIAFVWEEK